MNIKAFVIVGVFGLILYGIYTFIKYNGVFDFAVLLFIIGSVLTISSFALAVLKVRQDG